MNIYLEIIGYAGTALVVISMMIALYVRVEDQLACQISSYCFISTAAASSHQLDAGLSQSHLSTAADTAADENIYFMSSEESAKCTVAAAFSRDNFT